MAVDRCPPGFEGLEPRVRRWLDDEQTLNERIFIGTPKSRTSASKLPAKLQPDQRASWRQEVVWLEREGARIYGPLEERLAAAIGTAALGTGGQVPLLLHPRPTASHRRLAQALGRGTLGEVRATPTASYRSVVACVPDRPPVVLKLSLGAIIGRFRRHVDEIQVGTAVLISWILDTIPIEMRDLFGLDWFPERSGLVDAQRGEGWLLRELPSVLIEPAGGRLIPVFSLLSFCDGREPLLVELIRREGGLAEDVVVEQILEPYVRALSYLLFVEGVHIEGHGQNVLIEWGADERPTGRIVLRDLGDASVSIPLRLARRRPLPELDDDLPTTAPHPLGTVASNHEGLHGPTAVNRAHEVITAFGLNAFVWSINQSLKRFFPGYDVELVRRRYLDLWRDAMMRLLPVKITIREHPLGIVTDEVIEHVLRRIDWPSLGSIGGAALPDGVEALRIGGRAHRRAGPVYDRLNCEWGELYIHDGLPVFFRPSR